MYLKMSLLSNWLNKKEKECERLKEMDFEKFWARKKVNEILNFSRRLFFSKNGINRTLNGSEKRKRSLLPGWEENGVTLNADNANKRIKTGKSDSPQHGSRVADFWAPFFEPGRTEAVPWNFDDACQSFRSCC